MHINSNTLFYDSLQKGRGRAFDYIAQNKKQELRRDLLNACLHNIAYDPQCEGSRGKWLFELITLTKDEEFYRQNIIKALLNTTEFWDVDQLYDLAAIWAKKGDQEAREIIYKTFSQQDFSESWLGGQEIIAIDGIAGLIYVAEVVGKRLLADHELWEDDYLISEASESFGREKVIGTLEKEALTNNNVRAYLDAVKSQVGDLTVKPQPQKKSKKTNRKTLDLATVIQQIENTKYSRLLLARFGKNATTREIEQLFARLLQETNRDKLIGYLCLFKDRQFPRLDPILLKLAQTKDEKLQWYAIAALANNQDDSIRDLALTLLKEQPQSVNNRVLKLLIHNYKPEDFQLIESILNSAQYIEEKHYLGMDLMDIIDTQKDSRLTNFAWWIYENTPCSVCRESILKTLIESKQATTAILHECLKDSASNIRTLAKKELSTQTELITHLAFSIAYYLLPIAFLN